MPKEESTISDAFPIAQANTAASDVAISSPQIVFDLEAKSHPNELLSASRSFARQHQRLLLMKPKSPDAMAEFSTRELAKRSVAREGSISNTSVRQLFW